MAPAEPTHTLPSGTHAPPSGERIATRARQPEPERAAFVSAECEGDPQLLSEVEALLASGTRARTNAETLPSSEGDPPPLAEARVPEAKALERGAILGRYVVIEWLGGGGMGVVYAAHDPELDRRVAIKLVKPEARARGRRVRSSRMRLLREAQAIARVKHPAVIAVHDVGTIGARACSSRWVHRRGGRSEGGAKREGHADPGARCSRRRCT